MRIRSGPLGLVAALVMVGGILVSGFVLGRFGGSSGSDAADLATGSASKSGSDVQEASVPRLPGRVLRINPITGPNRPPMPADRGGPFGSRRTTGTAEVALTFDDGPDPEWTPQVLGLLREYRVKATFCLIGVNVVKHPQLVRDIVADGHTLCNHSWRHDVMLGSQPRKSIIADLARTGRAIRAAARGARISYYRQPGGAWTPGVVSAARRLGMTSLHWEVDPEDWTLPGASRVLSRVTSRTRAGAIVLMHDGGGTRAGTVTALRSILPNLSTRFRLIALPPGVDPPKLFGFDRPVHHGQQ